jgi:uracil phosphoribosyltransferase
LTLAAERFQRAYKPRASRLYGVGVDTLKKLDVPLRESIYKVHHPELPENTYIICMPEARKILFDPVVCGDRLKKLSLGCSKVFLKVAWTLLPSLRKIRSRDVCEIVVLRGSLGYCFDEAFEELFGSYLPRCFVGARRFRISGGEFGAEITYRNFDPLPDNGVLLTGDTIATGASLSRTLAEVRDELRRRDYGVRKLLVFSIAASFKGCSRLLEWEQRFREWWPEFRIYLFVAEALFGLADNGTDLLFRREGEAILPDETKARVSRLYGDYETSFLAGNMCAIFDWGDRNFKPERHLEDVLRFVRSSLKVAEDEKSREVLRRVEREAKLELKRLDQQLVKASRF